MQEIRKGVYAPGQRIPSEASLGKKFTASRITIGRALRELQQAGLVDRIAGSGTYVRKTPAASRKGLVFGLIIPDLGETEIFEPICQGIAGSTDASGHALLWAHSNTGSSSKEDQILELCRHSVERAVSGVFFAPLEMAARATEVNNRVLRMLRDAGIAVVLLDRRPETPAAKERCDLVGIDNHRAGYLAAQHLISLGARRIGFISFEAQASTVKGRIAGYRDALAENGQKSAGELTFRYSRDERLDFMWRPRMFDAFVCANDRIAGSLMHTLLRRSVRIPEEVRIVGIDDVAYASLLPVPLTTVHQPCRDIGEAALKVMLERLDRPKLPARNVLLDCSLVIRASCGMYNYRKF